MISKPTETQKQTSALWSMNMNQIQRQLLLLKAIRVYRRCKLNGKLKLAEKICIKYDLGNGIHALR